MIGKVKSCVGGTALANYVMKDGKGYELFRNNLSGETPTEILQEMKIIQNLNQKGQYKTLSLVLSPDKTEGQKLSNKELKELTLSFMKELKIDIKNQQYLAFVHTEKEHKHIHIICNRVTDNGSLISDNFIGKRAQWAAHRIAKEKGLISAKERMIENIKSTEKGKNADKILKNKIFEKHKIVLKLRSKSMEEYQNKMQSFGVKVIPTINRQGQIQGHRFLDLETGKDFKASEIHRNLGLKELAEKGFSLSGQPFKPGDFSENKTKSKENSSTKINLYQELENILNTKSGNTIEEDLFKKKKRKKLR